MHKKAQAEFALILGLLIIAVVVGLYAYSAVVPPSIQPSTLTEDQKAAASYVNDLVREAATNTLAELYTNGGYLDNSPPQMGYVSHKALGKRVAFWQMCENFKIPDVRQEFSRGVKGYIEARIPDSQVIGGRNTAFAKQLLAVDSSIYDNKITLSVSLPTSVEGRPLPQPYFVEVATKLGRIFDFAENFAKMQADCRVLDNSLMLSLMQSNENSKPCWIPILGNAQRTHTFTWSNLRDCMEMHIKYSLSNTLMGEEFPLDENGKIPKWAIEFFPVPAVIDYSTVPGGQGVCSGSAVASSKKYDDLNINFYYGDDDGLDRSEFSGPEYLRIQPKVGSFTRFLMGLKVGEYSQSYSVRYPVIVNVWDSSLKKGFRFATGVYIEDNTIGSCSGQMVLGLPKQNEFSQNYDDTCVGGASEDANILVRYKDGSDVIGATVSFVGCQLGTTGAGGPVQTKVPPVWGALTVMDGQNEYTECHLYSDLKSMTMTIPKAKHFVFNFSMVTISKTGTTYKIEGIAPATKRVEVSMRRGGDICQPPDPEVIINMKEEGAIVSSLDVANLPADEHEVAVALYDEGQNLRGFMNTTSLFTPSSQSLLVYAPYLPGFTETDYDALRSLYTKCGMEPLSDTELQNKVGCSWTG
jgi:hypothetical protein